MPSSYITAGCRTPLGKYLGGLASLKSVELGAQAISASVQRSGVPKERIEQVLMGQVLQAGVGQSPARQSSTLAGIPPNVGAATINKVCGSGLYSVMMADSAIRAGDYRCVVAGGMESMSQAPHLLHSGRSGWKYGDNPMRDAIDTDGLRCAKLGLAMGCIAEWTAVDSVVSRQDQDAWALRSHQLALAAMESHRFTSEIVPVSTLEGKKTVVRSMDEGPRIDCNLESLAKLPAVFDSPLVRSPDNSFQGTVTAGNASTLADGAAAVVVVDEALKSEYPTDQTFRIVGHVCYAGEHRSIFTAPVGAVQVLLQKTKIELSDIDLFEINEAFAAQTLACIRKIGIDHDRVNVAGGAISLGHPLGCSGTRVLVTLMHNLIHCDLSLGIATLCLGGGEAVAMLIERTN